MSPTIARPGSKIILQLYFFLNFSTKIEYFLRPGTIIVIDGRTSNYQFLKNNFQRKWKTFEDYKNGQFFLILDEVPLGNLSSNQNEFYFK